MRDWRCALELDENRERSSGSEEALCQAIRRGANLRVLAAFRFNEHVDQDSDNDEQVHETLDLPVSYLLDEQWSAGVANLRVPVELPDSFGPRPSISFFLYNQDGRQALARPFLDGDAVIGGPYPDQRHLTMPKHHLFDQQDDNTNAPSNNFVYEFDFYRYLVWDGYEEVLSHDADGAVRSGSLDALAENFEQGRDIKVGIRSLCADVTDDEDPGTKHEVFIHIDHGYLHPKSGYFIGATHPLVRVKPAIPLAYQSHGWDFGWLLVRTDGHCARWLCDPYTLKFHKSQKQYAVRWFVRATEGARALGGHLGRGKG